MNDWFLIQLKWRESRRSKHSERLGLPVEKAQAFETARYSWGRRQYVQPDQDQNER